MTTHSCVDQPMILCWLRCDFAFVVVVDILQLILLMITQILTHFPSNLLRSKDCYNLSNDEGGGWEDVADYHHGSHLDGLDLGPGDGAGVGGGLTEEGVGSGGDVHQVRWLPPWYQGLFEGVVTGHLLRNNISLTLFAYTVCAGKNLFVNTLPNWSSDWWKHWYLVWFLCFPAETGFFCRKWHSFELKTGFKVVFERVLIPTQF